MSAEGSVHEAHSRTASIESNGSVISSQRERSASVGSVTSRTSSGSNSCEQCHVEYILVAQFEVDQGPLMEHQYPNAISGDEHMLAELMLPDQAHLYEQDWTVFFLHRDAEQADGKVDLTGQAPLLYVLNLVITKHDSTVKRGAKVKAMAICTRHSFLHIYKPILLLALEEYFKYPTIETLEKLYNSVNEMDLSCMPQLSVLETQILSSSDNKEMFIEKFEEALQNAPLPQRSPSSLSQLQNGESGLMMKMNGDKPTKPTTYIDLSSGRKNGMFSLNRDTHEFETRVAYNSIKIPVKIPVAILPETVGDFSLIQLITTFSTPHSQNPQPFPLHPHLTTNGPYTHPIIVLVNALLTEKRVVFLGKAKPSGEVVDHVLAACALASGGTLRGFTRHAFPYTDLSKVDELLRVSNGFIAGVKNPAFANHDDWWDILCNIDTGRIKISPSIKQPPPSQLLSSNISFTSNGPTPDTGDNAFMDDVLHCIASRFGESAVRARWRDWIVRFSRMAAAFEEAVYGASALWIGVEESHIVKGHGYVWPDEGTKMRDLQANASRIEGWRNTRSYYNYVHDLGKLYTHKPIKTLDLHHQIDRLRTLRLSHFAASEIFMAIHATMNSYEAVNQLLCCIPEYQGGLFPIAVGLFHPYQKTKFATVEILERVRDHMAGRHFFNSMNRFQKLAFVRLKGEKDAWLVQQQAAGLGLGLEGAQAGSPLLGK